MNSLKLELMKVRLLTFMRQTKNFACYLLSCAHPHTSKWTRPSAAPQTESESCAVNLRAFWQLHHYMKEKTAILSKEVLSVSNCAWTEDLQSCKHGSETLCGIWTVIQNQYNKLCDRTDMKPIKHMPVLDVNALDISTQHCGSCDFHGPGYEVYPRSYTRNAVYTENRCLGSACPVYIINTSILVTVWC